MISTLFSHGFRPFFLAAGLYAVLPMCAWLFWIGLHAVGGAASYMTISEAPHLWHGHEMVYGFGVAAISGFLLTAVPNWTGTKPLQGLSLAIIFMLWVTGRAGMWFNAYIPVAVVAALDVSSLVLLFFICFSQMLKNPMPRNVVFLGTLLLLFCGNLLYHLEKAEVIKETADLGLNIGLFTLIIMITVIGGRVIPAFTGNFLKKSGIEAKLPSRYVYLDALSILSVVLYMLFTIVDISENILFVSALSAVLINTIRFSFWRTNAILKESIVWVLHLGYLWLIGGFVLLAIAHGTDLLNVVSARHALATGAAGTMIIAIMTRASLGHSGREITTPRPILFSYILLSVCALLRSVGPAILPDYYNEIMLISGLLWIAAYMMFVIVFMPILTQPRANA